MYYILGFSVLCIIYLLIGNYFYDFSLNSNKDKTGVLEGNARVNHFTSDPDLIEWFTTSNEEVKMKSHTGNYLYAYKFTHKESNTWVIVLHGYDQEAYFMSSFVKHFYDLGYNVLAPDLLGHGKSGGNAITMGGLDSIDVALWAKKITQENPGAKILIFGISMGAATTLNTLDKDLPSSVVGFIEDSGYVNLEEIFSYQLKKLFNLPNFLVLPPASLVTKIRAGYSFKDVDASPGLKATSLPGLILHGENDDFVPVENAKRAFDLLKSQKKIYIFDDAIHVEAAFKYPEKYWKIVEEFIQGVIKQ